MPLRYKTTTLPVPVLAPALATRTSVSSSPYSAPSPSSSPSSSSSPTSSSLAVTVSQSPWWPAVSGLPTRLSVVLAIVALVVVAVQRFRAAVHSRRLGSRAVSTSKMSARPGPSATQPYGDPLPQLVQLPPTTPSQRRRDQRHTASSSRSSSSPLVPLPLATVDRAWPPPPPMPTLALLQSPVSYELAAGSRDEYYGAATYQSPDPYHAQYHYGYPPFSAGPYPPPPGLWLSQQQDLSAAGGAPRRFFPASTPPSGYTYPPPFPLGPLPPAETTVLPPLHPDVTDSPLPGQKLPPPHQQPQPKGQSPSQPQLQPQPQPQPQPPPSRTHRRSYSQKIIYPKSFSPGSRSTTRSAPEFGSNMRDADPLTTPGGTTARGFDVPEGEAMGIEVSEEIIVAAEGWRRHTRVYGGGVCMACLESDAEMKERGINTDVGPILMEGFDPRHAGQQQQQFGESARQGPNQMLGGEGETERTETKEGEGKGSPREESKLKKEKETWWQQGTATGAGEAAQDSFRDDTDKGKKSMGGAEAQMSSPSQDAPPQ